MQLQKYPDLIEPLNKRVKEILADGMKPDTARYIRFILNEDIMEYKPKETKKAVTAPKPKPTEEQRPDPMVEILKLSKTLTNDK